jgi:hypothetical protein
MNWQPIETAPMDGTRILACGPYEDVCIVRWKGPSFLTGEARWVVDPDGASEFLYSISGPLTLWAHIPTPPQQGE